MPEAEAAGSSELTPGRKWLLAFSVMVVAVMQVLDTSVTNVALPHNLAANAVVIPATGWLTACFGRRRFFPRGIAAVE